MKDIQADILAVRAGVMTLKEAIARQGYEPAQVLAEIAATNAELDATLDETIAALRRASPDALRATKGLAAAVELMNSEQAMEHAVAVSLASGRLGMRLIT